jgi:hypothetical protein
MYMGLHVNYPLFSSDFNETWIFATDFRKKTLKNIKFHKNRCSGNRGVPCGQIDGEADMTLVMVFIGGFAKAPRNRSSVGF